MASFEKTEFDDTDGHFGEALVKFTSERRGILEQLTIPDPNNPPLVKILKKEVQQLRLENDSRHSNKVRMRALLY